MAQAYEPTESKDRAKLPPQAKTLKTIDDLFALRQCLGISKFAFLPEQHKAIHNPSQFLTDEILRTAAPDSLFMPYRYIDLSNQSNHSIIRRGDKILYFQLPDPRVVEEQPTVTDTLLLFATAPEDSPLSVEEFHGEEKLFLFVQLAFETKLRRAYRRFTSTYTAIMIHQTISYTYVAPRKSTE